MGDGFCFKVLTETEQVVSKGIIRSTHNQSHPNHCVFSQDIPMTGIPPSDLTVFDSRGGNCITTNMSDKQNLVVKDKLKLLLQSEEIRTVKTKNGKKNVGYYIYVHSWDQDYRRVLCNRTMPPAECQLHRTLQEACARE